MPSLVLTHFSPYSLFSNSFWTSCENSLCSLVLYPALEDRCASLVLTRSRCSEVESVTVFLCLFTHPLTILKSSSPTFSSTDVAERRERVWDDANEERERDRDRQEARCRGERGVFGEYIDMKTEIFPLLSDPPRLSQLIGWPSSSNLKKAGPPSAILPSNPERDFDKAERRLGGERCGGIVCSSSDRMETPSSESVSLSSSPSFSESSSEISSSSSSSWGLLPRPLGELKGEGASSSSSVSSSSLSSPSNSGPPSPQSPPKAASSAYSFRRPSAKFKVDWQNPNV
mmetsp:Transcript_2375/g.4922  ORF Transcript_2375/g.4922 Transcript_2375/m.4922 type:complete len:286 (-) Transcript_2375:290-1147(-)